MRWIIFTAVAITVTLAQAAPTKRHLKLTIKDATINSQGDGPGDKQSTAGLVSGQPFGHAVESITDKVTSATTVAAQPASNFSAALISQRFIRHPIITTPTSIPMDALARCTLGAVYGQQSRYRQQLDVKSGKICRS